MIGIQEEQDAAFSEISQRFQKRDEGDITSYLGMAYQFNDNQVVMGMSAYIDDLLKDYEMSECKPARHLPYVLRDDSSTSFKELDDRFRYAWLIGSLSYLAQMMRRYIMLTVRLLAQHVNNPSVTHWRTGKELLRYLKHTRAATLCIVRGRDDEVGLRIFSDADFGHHDDRKSFTGYVCMLGQNLVDWRSRKQMLVTTSTTEAELVAMSEATEVLE